MTDYDGFASAYSHANEANLLNAWYERPAMVQLAGEVQGRRVLTLAAARAPWPPSCGTGAPS
ncbi:hypothetical protein [Ornithinimicrobium sp. W1665]|uniref:hypothetical protein n=1 Tax=Ornithinimicrobium sp. W1665 TaxID=3416666 RepID=UPI003D6BDC60